MNGLEKLPWIRESSDLLGNTLKIEIYQESDLVFSKYLFFDYFSFHNYFIVHYMPKLIPHRPC